MSGLGMALGGAMQGMGRGLVLHGENLRKDMREKREAEQRKVEIDDSRAYQDRVRNDNRSYDERQRQSTIKRGADALTSGADFERATYVRDKFVDLGYPRHVADGMVGNIMQESGPSIDTGAVGDNGNAIGMAQWNGPRRKAFMAYAKSKGVSYKDVDLQIEYLDHEMRTTEAKAFEALMQTQDAEEAALVASRKFWRPGTPHEKRRTAYARSLAELVSDPNMPSAARDGARVRLDKLNGTTKEPAPTGKTWVPRGDVDVLMGVRGGKMVPYQDGGGNEVTRPIKRTNAASSAKSLSSSMNGRIDDWADGEALEPTVKRKFKLEVERLINSDGLTENAAWDKALSTANRTADETNTSGGFLGTGLGSRESVTPGTYDGTFGEHPTRSAAASTVDPDGSIGSPLSAITTGLELAATTSPRPKAGQAEIIRQARAAIAKGANPKEVRQRIIEAGGDPEEI